MKDFFLLYTTAQSETLYQSSKLRTHLQQALKDPKMQEPDYAPGEGDIYVVNRQGYDSAVT